MDRGRKRELRELNARAWAGEKDIFPTNASLDSSLKKNTAFIKRLRTAVTAPTLNTFLQEIRTLSLHKYLSEIISACYEGLCKLKSPAEIDAGIEIVCALHQRFGPAEFTTYLGWLLGRGMSTPEKAQLKALGTDAREREEKERMGRHRVLLKVITELWLVGVLKSLEDVLRPEDAAAQVAKGADQHNKSKPTVTGSKAGDSTDAEPFPLEVLKDLLGHDREHANLPLVVAFVKSFGWDLLGVNPSKAEGRKSVEADGDTTTAADEPGSAEEDHVDGALEGDPPFASAELQERFRNILNRYFDDVKSHVLRDQKMIVAQGRRNAEAYVKSGEVFEDRQANYEKQLKAQERLIANAQILSDVLGAEMPDLQERDTPDAVGNGGIGLIKTGEYLRSQADGAGIWEDEEERRFYENLIDLKDRVPSILLEDVKKKKADGDEQVGKKVNGAATSVNAVESKDDAQIEAASSLTTTTLTDTDDQSTAIANKTVGAQVDALLARLPELSNKDMIDQAAIDFCFLNSKASRNRLLKAVQEVPKGRSDLLSSYARLVATLGKYLPDITQGLVAYLDDEFRSLQRRKQKDFLGQIRTSNIRYLAELTKFGVVPEHIIFHCLRVGLDDFSRMNIEIICNLLENCGRYLLRNPETSPRMTSFLETLQRKKSAQHLGQQERMLIENAMYYVDPPQRAAIQQKERTPIDLYIRKLIYLDMNKRNYTKVLKSIRKLHWEEQAVVYTLEKIFSKPGKVKYSNIHLLAILAGALYRYHQDFVITVVDNVVEQITLGLEQNDFKFNQRRIAEVKYLGELYNYKMVDSPVIFDTLYRIVTFGHGKTLKALHTYNGTPTPQNLNPLDMPDDFFRIRLVCNVLDTCGVCFDRGTAKKKLDFFLTFFQYYIYTKDTLPMDIDFIVQDTFALVRPQWKLATNFDEAGRTFADAVAQNYKTQEVARLIEPDESDSETSSEDAVGEDELRVPEADAEDQQSSSEDVDADTQANGTHKATGSDSDDEKIVVTFQQEERDPEADAEFDRELAKLMAESLDSRKFDRKLMFDVPLPMRRAPREMSTAADDSPGEGAATPPNTMAFSLMTKRGSRQQTRTIEMPSDSHFAVALKTQQQAEREEQQRIKNLVLNYDLRDDTDAHDGDNDYFNSVLQPNVNTKGSQGLERHSASHASHPHVRPADKSGTNRSGQRARKLQLSDVDWYDQKPGSRSWRQADKRTLG